MEKKSKAEIKKLIADLHKKNEAGEDQKSHSQSQEAGKSSKGSYRSKSYRPKV